MRLALVCQMLAPVRVGNNVENCGWWKTERVNYSIFVIDRMCDRLVNIGTRA